MVAAGTVGGPGSGEHAGSFHTPYRAVPGPRRAELYTTTWFLLRQLTSVQFVAAAAEAAAAAAAADHLIVG